MMSSFFLYLLSLALFMYETPENPKTDDISGLPCAQKHYPQGDVCVCNSTYCDTIQPPTAEQFSNGEAMLYVSSKSGKRFQVKRLSAINVDGNDNNDSHSNKVNRDIIVNVDPSHQYQEILGFGGAFTDAASINWKSLSRAAADNLAKSYFSDNGIQYTVGRVPIASCDFSTHVYSYCDKPNDFKLNSFALSDEDLNLKIPFIKRAKEVANGTEIRLFASPWASPAWTKTSGKMQGAGRLKGDLHGPYYSTWANYYVRFFEEYSKRGVNYWGVTLENEPSAGLVPFYPFQALYFSAAMQRDFITAHLGPALKNNSATAHLKLMVHDDQRCGLPDAANTVFHDEKATTFTDGVAVHWYSNTYCGPELLDQTHDNHPSKFILATEACEGVALFTDPLSSEFESENKKGPLLGDWDRATTYAKDIIENLNHWSIGWTDWNLCLDLQGGPNWVRNFVDAPIIVNASGDEFYKQPMFYAMGHFSKFIGPGSRRVGIHMTSTKYGVLDRHSGAGEKNQQVGMSSLAEQRIIDGEDSDDPTIVSGDEIIGKESKARRSFYYSIPSKEDSNNEDSGSEEHSSMDDQQVIGTAALVAVAGTDSLTAVTDANPNESESKRNSHQFVAVVLLNRDPFKDYNVQVGGLNAVPGETADGSSARERPYNRKYGFLLERNSIVTVLMPTADI